MLMALIRLVILASKQTNFHQIPSDKTHKLMIWYNLLMALKRLPLSFIYVAGTDSPAQTNLTLQDLFTIYSET